MSVMTVTMVPWKESKTLRWKLRHYRNASAWSHSQACRTYVIVPVKWALTTTRGKRKVTHLASCRHSLNKLFAHFLFGCQGTLHGWTIAYQQLVSLTPLSRPVDVTHKRPDWAKQIKILFVLWHEWRSITGLQDYLERIENKVTSLKQF